MAKQVRALTDGFYNGSRIRAGKVFAISDGHKLGKWMEEIKPKTPEPAAKPAPKPKAKAAESGEGLV